MAGISSQGLVRPRLDGSQAQGSFPARSRRSSHSSESSTSSDEPDQSFPAQLTHHHVLHDVTTSFAGGADSEGAAGAGLRADPSALPENMHMTAAAGHASQQEVKREDDSEEGMIGPAAMAADVPAPVAEPAPAAVAAAMAAGPSGSEPAAPSAVGEQVAAQQPLKYPEPELYVKGDSLDEQLIWPEVAGRRPEYHIILNSFAMYNEQGLIVPLESVTARYGTPTKIHVHGEGSMMKIPTGVDGSGLIGRICLKEEENEQVQEQETQPSTADQSGNKPEAGIAGGATALPDGTPVQLGVIQRWEIDFGADFCFVSIRTKGNPKYGGAVQYKLGQPSPQYAPWWNVFIKVLQVEAACVKKIQEAEQQHEMKRNGPQASLDEVVQHICQLPSTDVAAISTEAAVVRNFLLTHSTVLEAVFKQRDELPGTGKRKLVQSQFMRSLKKEADAAKQQSAASGKGRPAQARGKAAAPKRKRQQMASDGAGPSQVAEKRRSSRLHKQQQGEEDQEQQQQQQQQGQRLEEEQQQQQQQDDDDEMDLEQQLDEHEGGEGEGEGQGQGQPYHDEHEGGKGEGEGQQQQQQQQQDKVDDYVWEPPPNYRKVSKPLKIPRAHKGAKTFQEQLEEIKQKNRQAAIQAQAAAEVQAANAQAAGEVQAANAENDEPPADELQAEPEADEHVDEGVGAASEGEDEGVGAASEGEDEGVGAASEGEDEGIGTASEGEDAVGNNSSEVIVLMSDDDDDDDDDDDIPLAVKAARARSLTNTPSTARPTTPALRAPPDTPDMRFANLLHTTASKAGASSAPYLHVSGLGQCHNSVACAQGQQVLAAKTEVHVKKEADIPPQPQAMPMPPPVKLRDAKKRKPRYTSVAVGGICGPAATQCGTPRVKPTPAAQSSGAEGDLEVPSTPMEQDLQQDLQHGLQQDPQQDLQQDLQQGMATQAQPSSRTGSLSKRPLEAGWGGEGAKKRRVQPTTQPQKDAEACGTLPPLYPGSRTPAVHEGYEGYIGTSASGATMAVHTALGRPPADLAAVNTAPERHDTDPAGLPARTPVQRQQPPRSSMATPPTFPSGSKRKALDGLSAALNRYRSQARPSCTNSQLNPHPAVITSGQHAKKTPRIKGAVQPQQTVRQQGEAMEACRATVGNPVTGQLPIAARYQTVAAGDASGHAHASYAPTAPRNSDAVLEGTHDGSGSSGKSQQQQQQQHEVVAAAPAVSGASDEPSLHAASSLQALVASEHQDPAGAIVPVDGAMHASGVATDMSPVPGDPLPDFKLQDGGTFSVHDQMLAMKAVAKRLTQLGYGHCVPALWQQYHQRYKTTDNGRRDLVAHYWELSAALGVDMNCVKKVLKKRFRRAV